jgi:hypothetical protein
MDVGNYKTMTFCTRSRGDKSHRRNILLSIKYDNKEGGDALVKVILVIEGS